jgi:hypothetical protein
MNTEPTDNFKQFMQILAKQPNTSDIYQKAKTGQFHYLFFSYLCWLSINHYGRLKKKEMQELITACQSWHSGVVTILSKLARTMDIKCIDNDLPKETKKIVDFAFNAELDMLENTTPQCHSKHKTEKQNINDVCHNLCSYINSNCLPFHLEDQKDILKLLNQCFDYTNHILIEQKLNDVIHQAKIKVIPTQQLTLADL